MADMDGNMDGPGSEKFADPNWDGMEQVSDNGPEKIGDGPVMATADKVAAAKKQLPYFHGLVTRRQNELLKLMKNKNPTKVKEQALKVIDTFYEYEKFYQELLKMHPLDSDTTQDLVADFESRRAKNDEILDEAQLWLDKVQEMESQAAANTNSNDSSKSESKSQNKKKNKEPKAKIENPKEVCASTQKLTKQLEKDKAELEKAKAEYIKLIAELESKVKAHSSVGGGHDFLQKCSKVSSKKKHKSVGDKGPGSASEEEPGAYTSSDSSDEVFNDSFEPSKSSSNGSEEKTSASTVSDAESKISQAQVHKSKKKAKKKSKSKYHESKSDTYDSDSSSSSSEDCSTKMKKGKNKKKQKKKLPSSNEDSSASEAEYVSKNKIKNKSHGKYAPQIPVKGCGQATLLMMPPKLPKFAGDHMRFKEFVTKFEARVASRTDDARELVSCLHECMEGEAAKLIKKTWRGKPEKAYERAWRKLREEYENPQVSANSSLHRLTRWKKIANDDSDGLEALADFLEDCLTSHKYLRHLDGVGSSVYVHTIFLKLPGFLQGRWNEHVLRIREKGVKFPTFKDIVRFISRQARLATDPLFSRRAVKAFTESDQPESGRSQLRPRQQAAKSFATGGSDGSLEVYCSMCLSGHEMDSCAVFLAKPLAERKGFVIAKRLCFGCLKFGHIASQCPQRLKCKICQKFHPTSLHSDGPVRTNGGQSARPSLVDEACMSANVPGSGNDSVTRVFHAVVPVRVSQGGRDVTTYAFLDGGSSASFISDDICTELGMSGNPTSLKLKTLHGTAVYGSMLYANITIADLQGNNQLHLPQVFSRPAIGIGTGCIARRATVAQFPHLLRVAAEMDDFLEGVPIGMLLGSNCVSVLEPIEVVAAADTGLFAVRVRHGWTVQGALGQGKLADEVMVNRAAAKEAEELREMVVSMYESEFRDDATPRVNQVDFSPNDRKFLDLVKSGTSRDDEHYVVPLPTKSIKLEMPNNRVQAVQRANSQMKKMKKDPNYREEYVAFMTKMLEKGYAREISEEELMRNDGQVWYLPHHGVMHPSKHKLRIVFDCAARYGPACLNDVLYQGPNLNNTLVGVLTRFRQHQYAFIADIEAMYHQVRVPYDQQSLLRFVWWKNGDLELPLSDFCMCSHVFGAISSPSIAIHTLRQTAEDHAQSKDVAEAMTENFYVDDLLVSSASLDQASTLAAQLHSCCARGGFRLTKYVANHDRILTDVPVDERADTPDTFALDGRPDVVERTLGLYWQISSDTLKFAIQVVQKPFTRRGVLALIASVFDPLGALAPAILPAKRILQLMSHDKSIGWDDELPDEHRGVWERWLSELPMLNQLELPRSFGLSGRRTDIQEISVYSDASLQGQAAVAFIKVRDSQGGRRWEFVAGKARVAPLRTVATIPRMELAAAVNAVSLAASIRVDLQYPVQVTYHTDSEVVLKYLSNQHHRQPVFVSNRVRLITGRSDLSQWKHVPSEENPADVGSRGISPAEMVRDMNWLTGPAPFSVSRDWSVDSYRVEAVEEDGKENNHVQFSTRALVDGLTNHYSTWTRACRAIVYLRKLVWFRVERKGIDGNGQGRLPAQLSFSKCTTGEEMASAEQGLLGMIQRAYYYKDYMDLKASGQVGRSSAIAKLSPLLHDGLIRVGGRLQRADLPYDAKHPILLPKFCRATALLVRAVHVQFAHVGSHHTLSCLRQRFWVVGGLTTVKRALHGCVTCRKVSGPFLGQRMADLPRDRVTQSPPFTNVGVDYFGPFIIKQGRSEVKRYGVIFVCLAVKACHLEVAASLDTTSFILALRRFVARRGAVRKITSDNGSNFVGAYRELRDQLIALDQSKIHKELASRHILWSFNPPYASHMGGIWERQIRTIRRILNSMLTTSPCSLSDEGLRTLLCEVECVINSRPLTVVPSDPKEPLPLTPEMLLTSKLGSSCAIAAVPVPEDVYSRREWKRVQQMATSFWNRWTSEYLSSLQTRQKWTQSVPNVKPGDVVLIKDEHLPRGVWPLGLITNTVPGADGSVREVVLKTAYTTGVRRAVHKLVLLFTAHDSGQV